MNYIGSKYSLIDFLQDSIIDFAGTGHKIFADLFAGTGVVGSSFKKLGYQVIANDIQYYSYVLNKHLVENIPPLDQSLVTYLNSLKGEEGFIYKNYCLGSGSGRCYFTDENGKKCDAMRMEIERLRNEASISEAEYFYLLASLINSIDKYANTASVYGAFLKKVKKSAEKEFELELLPVISGSENNKVYNEDVNELINRIDGDILYLDPPYNARQYCTNYHVLETIARYDSPVLKGKTGLRDYQEQKSAFCSKRTVTDVFENLIKNAQFQYIFLSYNNEGLMPISTIKDIMSKYGKYTVCTKEYKRFRADKKENRNHKADETIEYLHCIEKK
jgi:adenine-specific DNA-methyltransferase